MDPHYQSLVKEIRHPFSTDSSCLLISFWSWSYAIRKDNHRLSRQIMEAIFGIEYVVVMRKLSFRFNFYTRFIIIYRCIQTLSLTLVKTLRERKIEWDSWKRSIADSADTWRNLHMGKCNLYKDQCLCWPILIGGWQHHDARKHFYCKYCQHGYCKHCEKTGVGEDHCQWASLTRNQWFLWSCSSPFCFGMACGCILRIHDAGFLPRRGINSQASECFQIRKVLRSKRIKDCWYK